MKYILVLFVIILLIYMPANYQGSISTSTNSNITVFEAQNLLNSWGCLPGICTHDGCFESTHMPELDKQDDEVHIFGFLIKYTGPLVSNGNRHAYAWVNSKTETIQFEEDGFSELYGRNYYANLPDKVIPVPKRDGQVIPYIRFTPPNQTSGVSYLFHDASIAEVYMEQLKRAGFNGQAGVNEYGERIFASDWVWSHEREEEGYRVVVIVALLIEERFHMNMFVNIFPI